MICLKESNGRASGVTRVAAESLSAAETIGNAKPAQPPDAALPTTWEKYQCDVGEKAREDR